MWKNECNKFKANIFNKQKCANCFKTREQHSQDALEFNRLTRVVSKCGYLFVAPNWDFTNPIYRTKRWQRRWFILYEDGELTYSVDDHADTIPQAIINLNTVFEITEADAITGNENSIAIVANDGIHFVKGACREESRLWRDILRLFPQAAGQTRQTIGGTGSRAKRSATFPGLRSLPGGAGGPAAQQQRLQMAAATNNYNKHLDSQVGSDGNETHPNDEHNSSSDNVDGSTNKSMNTNDCYDDSGLPPTPPTTSPPDSSPENSPALKTKKISTGMMHDPIPNKKFSQAPILKGGQITTSTPTSVSFCQLPLTTSMPTTIKKSLSTLSPSAILESNSLINDSTRSYKRETNKNNNNVNYKSPYQRYERSKTADFTSTLASASLSTSSASSLSSKRTKSVVSDSFRNCNETENMLSDRIPSNGNNNSFSSVSNTNSVTNADRNSPSSSLNIDNLSTNNSLTEDSMEDNARNMSSIGSRISSAMNRKRTSLSSSPYSGLSSSTSLTTSSVSNNINNNSRRSTSLLSSLPPSSASVRLPSSSPLRNNGLSQSPQGFGSHSSEVHKSSITSNSSSGYVSVMNNSNSLQEEDLLPDPPTESRGTPDGCGLENASELLNKKGWLMKQGLTKEWHKYWFVLQDVALLYYRDPKAESKGFLDGIIDLSQVQRIDKQELPRHFGFYIRSYEGKTTVFSAITDGIRKNWIASLQKAANVSPTSASNNNDSSCSTNNSSVNMRKRSSINEMDVITTTRIVRASTTTPPHLTKVPSLPPPLTLQTSTTTMTFSTEVFDDDEEDDTTDEEEEDDFDSEDCDDESEDEIDGHCILDNKDIPKTDHSDLIKTKEDSNLLNSNTLDEISSSNLNNTDGVLVDLLETEVDSLKSQLEKTQSELYSLHHSNISRGHSASSSSHSSLQSMSQQQYIVPSSNNNSLTSLSNNNNIQQQVQTPSQTTSQQQQQQTTALSGKRYNSNNNNSAVLAPPSNQSNTNLQQSAFHNNKVTLGEESLYSSSLHQKAQQHKQQLQQQQQLVDQLSKDHTETLSQLNKTKSTIAKQTVEISSLKAKIKQNQIQIKQNLHSAQEEKETNTKLKEQLTCLESTVNNLREKLQIAEEAREKEAEKISDLRHEYECNLGKLETEVDKWKLLHESLYLQYNRELRSWEDRLSSLENERSERESGLEEEQKSKDRIVSDLSEQLKESDDRIQELLLELESARDSNESFAVNNEESFSRLVVSMEEKFAASLKSEKEQLEVAFRERLKEHELYEHEQRLVTAGVTASASTFGNCFSAQQFGSDDKGAETNKKEGLPLSIPLSAEKGKKDSIPLQLPSPISNRFIRRPSLVKINSMTDLLNLKVPSMEAIETMEREDMTEKFLILLHHFYASVDEIRKLRVRLRQSQDVNDSLEIDKLRFEESFKRTIVMQEQQEGAMSKRIQDLTGKLLASEKTARQLKDMMSSSSHRKHSRRSERKDSKNVESAAAATAAAAATKHQQSNSTNCQ